jgi:hypothetical protein
MNPASSSTRLVTGDFHIACPTQLPIPPRIDWRLEASGVRSALMN